MIRRKTTVVGGGVALLVTAWLFWSWLTYPTDRTPQGAYLRVVTAVNRGKPEEFFAYLETPAQHACYTIKNYRKKILDRVLAAYPEPERTELSKASARFANAPDGADVFAMYAHELGWLNRLRRDMSGIHHVEVQGERASVQTARGTRYPFRRRENGIWGLTLFTATLVLEAQKSSRDYSIVDQAAADYQRVSSQHVTP
ncbi:MAG TPA: hypothetical protein VGJ84_19565 [Polyangiaceae bacterium]